MSVFQRLYHKLRIILSSFRAKLLCAFFLSTIVPLSLVGFIAYSISYSVAEKQVLESVFLTAGQQHNQMDSRIRQAEQVADTLQYSLYTLKAESYDNLSDYIEALISLRNNISLYKSTFDFYTIRVFLPPEFLGSAEGLTFFPLDQIETLGIARESLTNLGSASLWAPLAKVSLPSVLRADSDHSNTAMCCRALHNQGSNTLEYAFMILIDTSEFHNILSTSPAGTRISSYVVTSEGYIAAHSNQEKSGVYLTDETVQAIIKGGDSYPQTDSDYYYIHPLVNGWYHVTQVPVNYIKSSTNILLRTILLTLIFSIPVLFIVVLIFSRTLTIRIHTLASAMNSYRLCPEGEENRLPLLLPGSKNPDYYDEVDMLGITFDQMIQMIHKNLNSILDLSLSEERLKYQLLQSQINPHFLYNILGSVQNCILLGKLDTADHMIKNLTHFYRMTLRKSEDLICIRDELKIAELYLEMEKLCLNNRLSWTVAKEEGIDNFKICKFTLQPFLENSILHGISGKTPHIHIGIDLRYGDDTVMITIQDDGAGMSDSQLYELQQTLIHKSVNYKKHFGVSNVNARIANELFGNGRVSIQSKLLQGTAVTIEFDQMEGIDEEDHDC